MDQDALRQLENQVMAMGLSGLQDPDLIELLARTRINLSRRQAAIL